MWSSWYDEIFHIWIADLKSSEVWSSQLWTQWGNCAEKPKKVRISTGFESVTSRSYWCDALTNWATKPLTLEAGHLWVLMSPWKVNVKLYMKHFIYWTADSFIPHGLIRTHKTKCLSFKFHVSKLKISRRLTNLKVWVFKLKFSSKKTNHETAIYLFVWIIIRANGRWE